MRIHIKLLTLLLALMMLLQASAVTVFAFEPIDIYTGTYAPVYTTGNQPQKYSDSSNSGQRKVLATTLDNTGADAYYNGSNEYDVLSNQNSSQILSALRNLMTSTHKKNSSYNDCWTYANKADCENNNGKVVLIYSNVTTTTSQQNSGYNREHVWPKSLGGYETSGPGADLHHIRPSDNRINSCRNNLKYGEVTGGKDATGGNAASGISGGTYNSTYFEPLDFVKGDVARICLYMYVRYGGSWSKCSSITNVFQSVDVLLSWCELDPVDTWELGRNEVVEAYQGNRNVFIDYPEYAWLIFGKAVPSDMPTPSSGDHNWDNGTIKTQPTCTTAGEKLYTCTDSGCGKTKTESIPALGHSWNGGAITLDPTCTDKGVKTYICLTCSSSKTENIAAKGHTYGAWIIDTEATETTTGSKHRVCATCNNTETATIPVIGHNHSYTSVVTKPTCTSQGYTTHSCECGDTVIDSYTSTIPHNYKNGYCVECGASDSSAPVYTVSDFRNAISGLYIGLTGEDLYNTIRNSVVIYNSLSDADKASVAPQYNSLKQAIAEYNASANELNADIDKVNHSLFGDQTMNTAVIFFAVYTLLNKKYV